MYCQFIYHASGNVWHILANKGRTCKVHFLCTLIQVQIDLLYKHRTPFPSVPVTPEFKHHVTAATTVILW